MGKPFSQDFMNSGVPVIDFVVAADKEIDRLNRAVKTLRGEDLSLRRFNAALVQDKAELRDDLKKCRSKTFKEKVMPTEQEYHNAMSLKYPEYKAEREIARLTARKNGLVDLVVAANKKIAGLSREVNTARGCNDTLRRVNAAIVQDKARLRDDLKKCRGKLIFHDPAYNKLLEQNAGLNREVNQLQTKCYGVDVENKRQALVVEKKEQEIKYLRTHIANIPYILPRCAHNCGCRRHCGCGSLPTRCKS